MKKIDLEQRKIIYDDYKTNYLTGRETKKKIATKNNITLYTLNKIINILGNDKEKEKERKNDNEPPIEGKGNGIKQNTDLLDAKKSKRLIIIGKSGYGKTFFIKNFLINLLNYDKLIIFTATEFDDEYRKIENPHYILNRNHFVLKFNSDKFERIIEFQKTKKKGGKKMEKILIILDDISSEQNEINKILEKYMSYFRHYNIDLVLSIQYYTMIKKSIRNNSTHLICKKIDDMEVLDKIRKSIGVSYSKKVFINLFNFLTSKRGGHWLSFIYNYVQAKIEYL